MQLLHGLLGVVTVLLGGLLVLMALDYLFPSLPQALRWGLLAAVLGAALAAGWAWLARPFLRRISLVRIARWIETRHPEIQERFSTILELSDHREGVSESLLRELIEEAEADAGQVDPRIEVRSEVVRRWSWAAGCLTLLMLVLFAVFPGETRRLFVRAVAPFSDLGNAGALRFEISPGDRELLAGDELRIKIRYSDPAVGELTLVIDREDGEGPVEESLRVSRVTEGGGEFDYRLPAAKESFRYFAVAGRARSDSFRITVWPLPRLEEVTVRYDFPDYTSLPDEEGPLGREVSALAGTQVELQGFPNTPVERGAFLIDDRPVGEVAVGPGAGHLTANWTLAPDGGGLGRVVLRHRLGREVEGVRFPINVQLDQPPVVKLIAPREKELRVRPDEQIEIEYHVEEDFAISQAGVELKVDSESKSPLVAAPPERDHSASEAGYRGVETISIGRLLDEWPEARQFKMRITVADNLPDEFGGPGVGHSGWRTFVIDRGAESLVRQEIRAWQSEVRESLQEAGELVQDAKERMERQASQMKEEELPRDTRRQFEEARQELAEARDELTGLAERMEQGVQAARTPEVRKIAEEVREARQQLEDAPLQATPRAREEALADARDSAEEALAKLRTLQEEVQRDEPKLEQLARLSELARRENELARQAAHEAREEAGAAPHDEWRQQQQNVEDSLRDQVKRDPEAQAAMLGKQAEAAQRLAEQARALAKRQEALARAAGQISDPAAVEAQHQVPPGQMPPTGGDEESSSEHGSPPDPPGTTSEQGQKLADQVRKARPAEALKAMQETQAAEAAKLAGEIANLPQLESGPDAMNQAARHAQQGGRQAREAAQIAGQGREQAGRAAEAARQGQGPAAAQQARMASESFGRTARRHQEASESFGAAAEALERAAGEFGRQSAEAAGRRRGPDQPAAPGEELAEALEASAQAADASTAGEAAQASRQAARALAEAASHAMQAQRGSPPPGQSPGLQPQARDQAGPPDGRPGRAPEEGPRPPQSDPGIPPELAELGVSAGDWEKLKDLLRSEVGGIDAAGVPEDYRSLVKQYFREVARGDELPVEKP